MMKYDLKYAHVHVKTMFMLAEQQEIPLALIAELAGVGFHTTYNWLNGQVPSVAALENCFNVMGHTLTPVLIDKPPVFKNIVNLPTLRGPHAAKRVARFTKLFHQLKPHDRHRLEGQFLK